MGIQFSNGEKKSVLSIPYALAKRQYPFWRWLFLVFILLIPMIILMALILKEYFVVTAPGYVAYDTITIRAPTNGFVEKLNSSVGEYVRKGQILLYFNSPELQSQLTHLKEEKTKMEEIIRTTTNKITPPLISMIEMAKQNIIDSKKAL